MNKIYVITLYTVEAKSLHVFLNSTQFMLLYISIGKSIRASTLFT